MSRGIPGSRPCGQIIAQSLRNKHKQECEPCNQLNAENHREYQRQYRKMQKPFVYAWWYKDGRCAYVGKGTLRRAKEHAMPSRTKIRTDGRIDSPWYETGMALQAQECLNEWHAMELEGRWGRRYQPLHNKEGYRR